MSTQISVRLEERLLRRLRAEARKRRVPRSDLIREALQLYFDAGTGSGADRPIDRVRDLVGSLRGGPRDLGARHREHLSALVRDRR